MSGGEPRGRCGGRLSSACKFFVGCKKNTRHTYFSYIRQKVFRLLKVSTLSPASQNGHSELSALAALCPHDAVPVSAAPLRRYALRRCARAALHLCDAALVRRSPNGRPEAVSIYRPEAVSI